jgi:hypothetical protein
VPTNLKSFALADAFDCVALVVNGNIRSTKWQAILTRKRKNFWKTIQQSSMINSLMNIITEIIVKTDTSIEITKQQIDSKPTVPYFNTVAAIFYQQS